MNQPSELLERARCAIPFVVIALVGIVLGGAISAASAPTAGYTSSWAVAYLVLVVGIAQLALGVSQWLLLHDRPPSTPMIAAEAVIFNLANVAVLLGTVVDRTLVVDVGGVLIIVALVLFLRAVHGAPTSNKWLLYAFRTVIVILVVTAPIGLIISAVRH